MACGEVQILRTALLVFLSSVLFMCSTAASAVYRSATDLKSKTWEMSITMDGYFRTGGARKGKFVRRRRRRRREIFLTNFIPYAIHLGLCTFPVGNKIENKFRRISLLPFCAEWIDDWGLRSLGYHNRMTFNFGKVVSHREEGSVELVEQIPSTYIFGIIIVSNEKNGSGDYSLRCATGTTNFATSSKSV